MSGAIEAYVAERGIREVLHFTTNHGLVGVFARGQLLSRVHLNADDLLDSVRLLNCEIRRDPKWTDYVNLSISTVNNEFLTSSRGWHPPRDGVWWAVLSFDSAILGDPGVIFTTTNNVYHQSVHRESGIDGLTAMYADVVPFGYYGSRARRTATTPANFPTHNQAEVLYPGSLDLSRLRAVYVPEGGHVDEIEGWRATIPNAPQVPIEVRPEVFR